MGESIVNFFRDVGDHMPFPIDAKVVIFILLLLVVFSIHGMSRW